MLDKLKTEQYEKSTKDNYYKIWRKFNEFVVKLDQIPKTWEERFMLYCTYMVKIKGLQSSTIKSYKSAIKAVLTNDGYNWKDEDVLMASLTRHCKLKNDKVLNRFPIRRPLLELMLYELGRHYDAQPYLLILYRAVFTTMYYGLLRISEIAMHEHSVKVVDVHITSNNSKAVLILRSSKTHKKNQRPQKIQIVANRFRRIPEKSNFCPVEALRDYSNMRSKYIDANEEFFVSRDRRGLPADQVRQIMRKIIGKLGLNPMLYDTHSFRSGRATDLRKLGYSVDDVKSAGRWKSNAVYDYLR